MTPSRRRWGSGRTRMRDHFVFDLDFVFDLVLVFVLD
jgi:hypothetical protein